MMAHEIRVENFSYVVLKNRFVEKFEKILKMLEMNKACCAQSRN